MTIKDEWQSDDGSVRLILGDSMVILPALNEVGAVVTDPPYGVGASGGMHSRIKAECKDWDDKPADVRPILSLSVPTIIWGGNYFDLPPCRGFLIWDKHPMPPSHAFGEFAWTNIDMNAAKWCGKIGYETSVKHRLHPTQKPVGLMVWCLGFLPIDVGTIVDPYMGSGSTGVACIRTGRRFIGIDSDADYYRIAIARHKEAMVNDRSSFQFRPKPRSVPDGFFKKEK